MSLKKTTTIIGQGAEATITLKSNTIIKSRLVKTYRHATIDSNLRKTRTRAEKNMLERVAKLQISAPKVLATTSDTITMSYIDGKKLKDELTTKNYAMYAKQLVEIMLKLHANNIIHNDLTTSNVLVKNKKLFLIDFGLSFMSTRDEDKACDLHLLHQALTSYHAAFADKMFLIIRSAYAKKNTVVIDRLTVVESRGKNKF